MAQALKPFEARQPQRWESFSTVSHGDPLSVYVSGADGREVRLAWTTGDSGASITLTTDAARMLAAQLIAAADSTVRVAEAA